MVLTRSWHLHIFFLGSAHHFADALKALDSRCKTCIGLEHLGAEVLQAKILQRLCALHVLIDLTKSIRYIIRAWPRCVLSRSVNVDAERARILIESRQAAMIFRPE